MFSFFLVRCNRHYLFKFVYPTVLWQDGAIDKGLKVSRASHLHVTGDNNCKSIQSSSSKLSPGGKGSVENKKGKTIKNSALSRNLLKWPFDEGFYNIYPAFSREKKTLTRREKSLLLICLSYTNSGPCTE